MIAPHYRCLKGPGYISILWIGPKLYPTVQPSIMDCQIVVTRVETWFDCPGHRYDAARCLIRHATGSQELAEQFDKAFADECLADLAHLWEMRLDCFERWLGEKIGPKGSCLITASVKGDCRH